jgi:hypothetical protein
MSVNKRAVRAWVNALRSGKYKQGKGHLTIITEPGQKNKHCCLGVACDLFRKNHDIPISDDGRIRSYDGQTGYLPGVVEDWLGNDIVNVQFNLVDMNDNGDSFDKIADYIESNFLKGGK